MKLSQRARRVGLLLTMSAAFSFGLLSPIAAGQTCQIIQSTCTYDVSGYLCKSYLCHPSFCPQSSPCCYYEYGFCSANPYQYMHSQICGGLCTGEQEP